MSETNNKRRLDRRRLTQYLRVLDRDTGKLLGQLENVTIEGIMLSSEFPLEEGKIYPMWMNLPAEVDGCIQITFDAKNVWSSVYTNAEIYSTGFCFTKIDEQNVELIKKVIEEYGIAEG